MRRIAIGLLALTVAGYWPVIHNDFVSLDDYAFVTNNPAVRSGLTWPSIVWAFGVDCPVGWSPLAWMSHMLDCQLFGLNPVAHHLHNLALHAVNVILAFLVLNQLTGAMWRSAVVAMLAAVHPLHVESVVWVAERRDVMFMLFTWLTIAAYAHYAHHTTWRRYVLTVAAFALALMSKPMAVTAPCILLLLDFWPLHRYPATSMRRLVIEKLPLLAMSAAAATLTVITHARLDAMEGTELFPLFSRVSACTVNYVTYLWRTVAPVNLACYYPRAATAGWQTALCAAFLIGITVAVVRSRRRTPYSLIGWLWFLGSLTPVIGLTQAGRQATADRFVYLPLIGIYLAVVWGIADYMQTRRVPAKYAIAAVVAIAAVLLAQTNQQVRIWRDSHTLYKHALAVTKDNFFVHHALGQLYAAHPDSEHQQQALNHYRQSVDIDPNFSIAQLHLGQLLYQHKQYAAATRHLKEAAGRRPTDPEALYWFGLGWLKLERYDYAAIVLEEARMHNPSQPEIHYALGRAYEALGRTQRASQSYLATLRLQPDHADARKRLSELNP